MHSPQSSSAPGGPQLRAAMNAAARDNLIPLTAVLTILYVVAGFYRANYFHNFVDSIVIGEFASAVVTLALLVVIVRYDPQSRWVHPTLFLVAFVAIADSLLQLSRSGAALDTTNLALIIAATGLVSLSFFTSIAIYSLIWSGWLWCAYTHPSNQWVHFGFFLLWTTAIAGVVQAARTSLLRRLIQSETRQREELEELVNKRTRQLEESLEQLRHSERLASVGTLAAGVAHEINNPVGVMLLSAEQLLAGPGQNDEKAARLARDIIGNAKRCGQIVKNVLRFAQQDPADRTPDDVNVVVNSAVLLTRSYAARQGGVIHTALGAGLPRILLNRIELEQVFVNLIRNSIEAADGKPPEITIATARTADAVRVTVTDNGCGIRPDDLSRIFDPFFTTRPNHGGMGLGLSVSYGIVTDHGGTIRVENRPAGGTVMTVELPMKARHS